ncbi:MAG: hypothetical protein HFE73_03840 [Firmicutes bacterium]|nr:hypothetical protein [Bacillota bacterium]
MKKYRKVSRNFDIFLISFKNIGDFMALSRILEGLLKALAEYVKILQ